MFPTANGEKTKSCQYNHELPDLRERDSALDQEPKVGDFLPRSYHNDEKKNMPYSHQRWTNQEQEE